jgi:hypothetical protein
MRDATQAGTVVPTPRIPKVMGILNIVFAAGLILGGLCMAGYAAMLPMIGKAMTQMQKNADAELEKKKQADLKAVDEEEKTAETDAEKRDLAERRRAIEARPKVVIASTMDFSKMGLDDPRLKVYGWVDPLTAVALNSVMLASGIGLVRRRRWGLTLGIWTAIAKIARLVLLYTYFALAVVPPLAQNLGKFAGEMIVQQQAVMGRGGAQPPGVDVQMLTRVYFIMYTITAVAMIVIGSIYPAISLWLLTRPGARAACDESQLPPGKELNETW